MTLYWLDTLAGATSLLNACLLMSMHVLTGPKKGVWLTLPEWVRATFFTPMVFFLWRGAEIWSIRGDASVIGGHATLATVGAGLALATLFGALVVYILSMTYPERVWDRIGNVFKLVSCRTPAVASEQIIPVMIRPDQALSILAAETGAVVIPASRAPDAWDDRKENLH